jgi:hypothetical protein
VASGATYYVRKDGNNANAGTTNAAGGAWLTITYAGQHATAGDTVRVQAGTYVETASGIVSGTSGNPVTLVADGTVTTCGMSFNSKSYIRVVGFTIDGHASGCSGSAHLISGSGTNTGLEFWNDTVTNTTGKGYNFDNGATCNQCIFVGGSVSNIGVTASSYALNVAGNDYVVAYVALSNICYIGIVPTGVRDRFLNDNFSGMIACGSTHPDNFYINPLGESTGYSNNLVESTFTIGTPSSSNNKWTHYENDTAGQTWSDNINRLNVGYNLGSSIYSIYSDNAGVSNILRLRWYNNSWLYDERAVNTSGCGTGSAHVAGSTVSVWFTNELAYECWGPSNTGGIDFWEGQASSGTLTLTRAYSLGYSPNHTVSFASAWTSMPGAKSNVDPKLTNFAGLDFTLQSASGARGVGGPLTTASGSGSNSTSLTVAANSGSFFIGSNASNLPQYNGQLVPGDVITVGSTTVRVSSVSGDTLTLASPISWSSGAPVYFGSSSTVDIGAYPYKAGGYALSAGYTTSGGIATVTPNDPSLVRFVVCYSDNVPYTVVNGAPYTCPVSTGAFSAWVYPRYASQTLGVKAVFGTGPPAAPTGVTIIR